MKSWSVMKKPMFALSFPLMAVAATPAQATVYLLDFLGTVTAVPPPGNGTLGGVAVGDPVNFLLRFDDTTPGAEVRPSFVFSGTGYPSPLTATLTISGQTYQNASNAFSYYDNDATSISGVLQNQDRTTGVIDTISFGINYLAGIKSTTMTETGSWYLGLDSYSYFERETGVTFTGVNPDYTTSSVDFALHYLTVYQEGAAIPPLAAGPTPEPSTWAMMLCGLAIVGAVMRRGKHAGRLRFSPA